MFVFDWRVAEEFMFCAVPYIAFVQDIIGATRIVIVDGVRDADGYALRTFDFWIYICDFDGIMEVSRKDVLQLGCRK